MSSASDQGAGRGAPGLRLVVGPPAAGKTAAMVAVAREACRAGGRVWWIALPHQRAHVLRRVTAGGSAVLGLEVVGAQQAYYRVLSAAAPEDLRPLVVGTARIVLVAEAFARATGALPSPGEAKLFAAAIAEAKRYEVAPQALGSLAEDAELERLERVYAAYEEALAGRWDYDDVRSRAARLVEAPDLAATLANPRTRTAAGLPDVVVVDGWRELGPLDWRFLRGLGRYVPVHVALPAAPDGAEPDAVLARAPEAVRVERYLAVNPVEEARWVLRSVKRDLACGLDPCDVAVVAPAATGDALLALADEYGVPLTDERGSALADDRAGRTLVDLLELPDAPNPAALLALPDLAPVAATALRLGLTGADALRTVARGLGLEDALERWLELLRPAGDPVEWTRWLLDEVLTLTQPDVPEGFRASVLAAAQHAARLAGSDRFGAWLVALLTDVRSPRDLRGGVAVLTADLASGRRFARCYVMGAYVGAYEAGEREDYFVPDEARSEAPRLGALPKRFAGRDGLLVEELLTRGDVTVVTAPTGGTEGRLVPDERLLGDVGRVPPLPAVPAGSGLEVGEAEVYLPATDRLSPETMAAGFRGERPDAEWLRVFHEQCGLMAWAGVALGLGEDAWRPDDDEAVDDAEDELRRRLEPATPVGAEWHVLVSELRSEAELTVDRLEALAEDHPWAARWLRSFRRPLTELNWGPTFVEPASGAEVRVDAGKRGPLGRRAYVYRFVEPAPPGWGGEVSGWHWAGRRVKHRWSEYLTARAFLDRGRSIEDVQVVVWPVLGTPIVYDRSPDNEHMAERMERAAAGVVAAMERVRRGDASPNPGRWCERCQLFYVCRLGVRG